MAQQPQFAIFLGDDEFCLGLTPDNASSSPVLV